MSLLNHYNLNSHSSNKHLQCAFQQSDLMFPFITIAVFIALGWLAQSHIENRDLVSQRLNQFVINIIMPAVILAAVPKMEINATLLFPMFACWLIIACSAIVILLFSHLLKLNRGVTGCLLLVGVLGNTSYLGFPIISSFFGEEGLTFAIIFDQLGSFIALSIYGNLVANIYTTTDFSSRPSSLTKKGRGLLILKRTCLFPPFILLVLSFLAKFFFPQILLSFTQSINGLLDALRLCLIPLTMFIIGLQFQLKLAHEYKPPLVLGLILKLLMGPLIVFFLSVVLSKTFHIYIDPLILKVSFVESGMPAMVTAAALAMQYQLAPRLAAALVAFGLLCSIIWSPLLFWLSGLLF